MTMPILLKTATVPDLDGGALHVEKHVSAKLTHLMGEVPKQTLTSVEEANAASSWLRDVQSGLRELETDRKSCVAPYNAAVKTINTFYKEITDEVEQAMAGVKLGLASFAAAEARREAEQRAAEKAAHTDDRPTAPIIDADVPAAPKAKISTYEHRTVEVIDWRLVPVEFLRIDEQAVLRAKTEVPGVRIHVETRVAAR